MTALKEKHLFLVGSWILAAALAFFLQSNVRSSPPDFDQFYLAGQLILAGQGGDIYNPAAFERLVTELNESGVPARGGRYFLRPAFAALPWAAVGVLPYGVVKTLSISLNLLGICLAAWKLPAWFPGLRNLRPWLICFPPFLWSVALGQDTIFIALALGYSFFLMREGRDIRAGLILSLCLVKPQLVWFVPAALYFSGKRRTVYSFGVGALALLAISLSLVGFEGMVQWRVLLASGSTDFAPKGMPTLRAISLLTNVWVGVAAAIAVGISLVFTWRNKDAQRLAASVIIASVLFSPHAYVHDVSVFAVAAGLQASSALRTWLLIPWPIVALALQPDIFPVTYAIAGLAAVFLGVAAHSNLLGAAPKEELQQT